MPTRKNPSYGLAALEAYLNEPLRPGYVGGHRSGNLLVNEYAANIPDTFEQQREAESMDYLGDITNDYRAQENARLAKEEAARTAGFRDVADQANYSRGMEQLKAMIPLQVAAMNAQGQQAARQAQADRFMMQQQAINKRQQQTQANIDRRQEAGRTEKRAQAVEAGKGGVGTSGLRDLFSWLPFVESNQDIRTREAAKIRQSAPRGNANASADAALQQAAQIMVGKYGDMDPMEMLAAENEDQMTPDEIQKFTQYVSQLRGF